MNEYIIQLLYQNNCVIIPKLGAFVANYKSAYVDRYRNVIYPPEKTIAFNKQLNKSDGLLVAYVSEQKMISYISAEQQVSQFADEVITALRKHKSYIFNQIGRLYKDSENNLLFESFGQNTFLIDSYGLLPVAVEPILRLKADSIHADTEEIAENTETESKRKSGFWALPAVAPFLLMMIIGSVILFGQFNFDLSRFDIASAVPAFKQLFERETIAKETDNTLKKNTYVLSEKDTLEGTVTAKATDTIIAQTVISENTQEVELPALIEVSEKQLIVLENGQLANIFICAGSFKNEINAKRLQKTIGAIGLKSVIKRTKFHQVLVASSTKNVTEDLAILREKISSEAFIYCQNCNY